MNKVLEKKNLGKIAAIIVTYNRCELLEKVLICLSEQTRAPDTVFIIDNASTDQTNIIVDGLKKRLGTLKIEYTKLAKNIGGAGGFYTGAKIAYEAEFDALWFMDDDTMPQTTALEFLEEDLLTFEAIEGYQPGFACSTVLWKNDDLCLMNIPSPFFAYSKYLHRSPQVLLVNSCSFVSVLVRREKIKKLGYPIASFFIWYDDVEFTERLSKNSNGGICSIKSRVHHFLEKNEGADPNLITSKTAWKFEYGLRNQAAVIFREYGLLAFVLFGARRIPHIFLKLRIPIKNKLRLFFKYISALWLSTKIEYPNK